MTTPIDILVTPLASLSCDRLPLAFFFFSQLFCIFRLILHNMRHWLRRRRIFFFAAFYDSFAPSCYTNGCGVKRDDHDDDDYL